MKKISFLLITIFAILLIISGCKTTETQITEYRDSIYVSSNINEKEAAISILKGEKFNHPTFVIWQEDMEGNFVQTIFITKSYASGVFGHGMVGDSMWMDKPGESIQPAALPYWTHKKGLINGKNLVPTPQNPYVDAYTGATPTNDFVFETILEEGQYKILLEVNQTWDWNKFWTNNKFPESDAYKHSAQPSIIYAVTINSDDKEYFLNPIGHGDPKGESGKLFTDLSTLTTAKEIFKSIKVSFK
ncbi:MAG: hypothetical protein JXL97_16505 [Bacteroidales bacterium]|nr:hypothetical protein [Bacteroidales bacterium]